MIFSPGLLLFISLLYLGLIFTVAYASEQGWLPLRWIRHPLVYTLSLGVFISGWGLYGVVSFAQESGFNFLTYYLGLSGAFLIAPLFLQPLLRLSRTHQLSSLPDMLAYRFNSQAVGTAATLAILIGMLPLLTAQLQIIGDLMRLLSGEKSQRVLTLGFCLTVILFCLLFGTRGQQRQTLHAGLVTAIAVESLIKLIAIAAVGLYAYFGIFGGHVGLQHWLVRHPAALDMLYRPLNGGYWHSLLLVFFFSAVVMPCMYHMAFTENREPRDLRVASWAVPLYLLLMALGIPVILWAGLATLPHLPAEYFTLGITLQAQTPALTLLLFVGSLAATSGILIVTTLALANMLLNHVLLPIRGWAADDALYRRTTHLRRLIIACIPLAAYLLSCLPQMRPDSTTMTMLALVATLQLAPALFCLLFWPRGNHVGMLAGLAFGMTVWLVTLMLPAFFIPATALDTWIGKLISYRLDHWQAMGMLAILGNSVIMVMVSLLTPQSEQDGKLAEGCSADSLRTPVHWRLSVQSASEFVTALTPALGPVTADREVRLALDNLSLGMDEQRPYAMRRLREQLGANLSGLLGPSLAQELIDQHLPHQVSIGHGNDITLIESRLEEYQDQLSGLAAELDVLRRFHRQTLHDLPLAVCTLAPDQEILSWNQAMMTLTGCSDVNVVGSRVSSLPAPWRRLMIEFMAQPASEQLRFNLRINEVQRSFNLHRAVIGDADGRQVLVIEETTQVQRLEARLQHAERLSSLGRLAAGVAHEVGNPVTGIASLAQNLRDENPHNPDIAEAMNAILEQTRRITRIVQSLVSFSRSEHHAGGQFEAVPLRATAEEAVQLLRLAPDSRHTRFRLDISPRLQVHGDAQRLCQAFINLLGNARDASTQEGEIHMRARQNGAMMQIEIEDFGHGLPDGDIRRALFEPFVTTKPPGKGTGLGLALVHGIISAHHGRIQITDKRDYDQGQGVIVQLFLPAARPLPLETET